MNSKVLNNIIIFICAAVSFWDFTTTITGLYNIFKSYAIAVIFAGIINAVLLFSFTKIENEALKALGIIALIVAIPTDFYTAYRGNLSFAEKNLQMEHSAEVVWLSVAVTIIMLICTFFTSYNIVKVAKLNDRASRIKKKAKNS